LVAILEQRGFEITYIDVGAEELESARVGEADLLVVLGGPIGVYETEFYPFLINEIDLISHRVASARPTLGICLGAQLMAKSLGSEVKPGPEKELGWAPIDLTEAGRASPLRHLIGVHVLHWHGDNFDLPPACENLASTIHCPFQAFRKGPNLLGIQFHIEADPQRIEAWLIGHAVELNKTKIDPRLLRRDTALYGPKLRQIGTNILNEWLDSVEF
jgi:GMP synthase (glutamine-hydrolysing)